MRASQRFVDDIPVKPEAPRRASVRSCMVKGCPEGGEFRAPKSPDAIDDYLWFCLEHVREYNQRWDFFRGMSAEDVERYIRSNVTGHRPTWSVAGPTRAETAFAVGAQDPYGLFDNGPIRRGAGAAESARRHSLPKVQIEALAVLELDESASLSDATARYKELVKRYHPDANGGDRRDEERLKRVIRAYRSLKASNFR